MLDKSGDDGVDSVCVVGGYFLVCGGVVKLAVCFFGVISYVLDDYCSSLICWFYYNILVVSKFFDCCGFSWCVIVVLVVSVSVVSCVL